MPRKSKAVALGAEAKPQDSHAQQHSSSDNDNVVTVTAISTSKPQREPRIEGTTLPIRLLQNVISMPAPLRLLVCSIGNPAPYTNTLHSAGHSILSSLRLSLSYPPFIKSRAHGNGLFSAGEEFTLWQSPTLMNVSGPAVLAAWKGFAREHTPNDGLGLVVIHDELELALGQVKVRSGDASPKGHNGLKSLRGSFKGSGIKWTRIGVGIGRPESREPDVVAGYVLRKMSPMEKGKLEVAVGAVEGELRRLRGE